MRLGVGFAVWDFGSEVWGSGNGVWGFELCVEGLVLRVVVFRVEGR